MLEVGSFGDMHQVQAHNSPVGGGHGVVVVQGVVEVVVVADRSCIEVEGGRRVLVVLVAPRHNMDPLVVLR